MLGPLNPFIDSWVSSAPIYFQKILDVTKGLFGFRLFCWKLKIYYWKYCSKIFFITENIVPVFLSLGWFMNSAIGPAKWNTKRRNAATQTHTKNGLSYNYIVRYCNDLLNTILKPYFIANRIILYYKKGNLFLTESNPPAPIYKR